VAAFRAATTGDPLPSWREGASKPAILDLVQQVTADGDDAMPPEEQVTVFDYDGTLRTRQPWQAAFDRDYGCPDKVITPHHHGDGMEA
jgi:hypothetical protein